jgi:hypothetical protein
VAGSCRRALLVATALALLALPAGAARAAAPVSFQRLAGYRSPGTPARYDKVGVLKIGSPRARNVLVLNPGTSASAAYFAPLARTVVARAPSWQVWSVERRENLLEDHSMLDRAKAGKAGARELFDYYLGWIGNPAIRTHFQPIPDSRVGYARRWGMATQVGDLRRVVLAARRGGRRVVLGGHSLGGTLTTAYATWDFGGQPGAAGLSGLVFIDGASGPRPVAASRARTSLRSLARGTPWLSFGGLPTPFAGLFNSGGSLIALLDPRGRSLPQSSPVLPATLRPPVPVTNEALYGSALDTATSPPALAAAQAHLGHLAAGGDPRGWDDAGELTPVRRYAQMFSGAGLRGLDGTAWYHPLRFSIDAGAVADGRPNAAQRLLGLRATMGRRLPHRLRIYAFAASLGGKGVLSATRTLARQSHIPSSRLTLIDRSRTYAHNDPNSASPRNAFVDRLVPFLARVARR